MDGLLVIDKPIGPTSHDVVARTRRAIGERRVGHTGTLDPAASGVLPLLVGRATRLARFLSAADKAYEAIVRLGIATDTYDATGKPVGPPGAGPTPSRDEVERATQAFRGSFLQRPPVYSAKKIGGQRSYDVARMGLRAAGSPPPLPLAPVGVTVRHLEIVDFAGECLTLRVECSAGFYVRSLAHDIGERLGIGAHLARLRRTRSGDASLADALPLEAVEQGGQAVLDTLIPLEKMLPGLMALTLTPEGADRAQHGRDLLQAHFAKAGVDLLSSQAGGLFRLFDPGGQLLGIAEAPEVPGPLHPFVVLV